MAREAFKIRPDEWDARLELAKGLYGQGQWDEALAELNTIDKDFPHVHLLKANVFMSLGGDKRGLPNLPVSWTKLPAIVGSSGSNGSLQKPEVLSLIVRPNSALFCDRVTRNLLL